VPKLLVTYGIDIVDMIGSIFNFKIHEYFNFRNKLSKNCNPCHFYLPAHVNIAPPCRSPYMVHNLLSVWL
jgi:hypothetical protein